jgi:hypothetical protein
MIIFSFVSRTLYAGYKHLCNLVTTLWLYQFIVISFFRSQNSVVRIQNGKLLAFDLDNIGVSFLTFLSSRDYRHISNHETASGNTCIIQENLVLYS